MKKIACLFVMTILALISSTAYADDGYFTCGSDVTEFIGKTFENLVIDLRGCHDGPPIPVAASAVEVAVVWSGLAPRRFPHNGR